MIRMLMALAILLGSAGAAAAQALSKAQFGERVAQAVRLKLPEAKVDYVDENRIRVVLPGEEAAIQSIERGYSFYREEPSRLQELVDGLSRGFEPIPVEPEALLVLVRTAASNPPPGPAGDRALTRPIAGDLIAIVAVDAPDAYKFLRATVLQSKLRLGNSDIWSRALVNTRARVALQPRALPTDKPVNISTGDGLASSLLLDDAFWNAPPMTAKGPVVVAVVGRDDLYVTPLSETQIVAALKAELARVANDPDTLSPKLLVRRNGRWEVLP